MDQAEADKILLRQKQKSEAMAVALDKDESQNPGTTCKVIEVEAEVLKAIAEAFPVVILVLWIIIA